MHATIAALSSGVPTAAIAYSAKFQGVFDRCGQSSQVHDPRAWDTEQVVSGVLASFEARSQLRADLAVSLPGVLRQADQQLTEILSPLWMSPQ